MFDYLCYQSSDSYLPRKGPVSHIRFLNISTGLKRFDAYADRYLLAKSISFKKYTPYFHVPSGHRSIKIFPSGTDKNPYIEAEFELNEGSIYTIASIENEGKSEFLVVPEHQVSSEGEANIRFACLSVGALDLGITLKDGTHLFSGMTYKSVTPYTPLSPGKFMFYIKEPSKEKVSLVIPDIVLKPGWNCTVYLSDPPPDKKELQYVVLLDGSTYIN